MRNISLVILISFFLSACLEKSKTGSLENNTLNEIKVEVNKNTSGNPISPPIPPLIAELLDGRNETSDAAIARFDFKNFTYPLPRGWQDTDSKEAEIRDGKRPILMPEENNGKEKRVGLSYLTTKFLDIDSDGKDEAVVILQIETGGSAMPHLVYIFKDNNGDKPQLLWYFRTGDRADGGLKNIYLENGLLAIELYGQDRYIIGEVETAKITGDEEPICCPTHYTKSLYKWDGKTFRLHGKRLTYSMNNKDLQAVENMIEVIEKQNRGRK